MKDIRFSVKLLSFSEEQIKMKIDFANPLSISSGFEPDKLKIRIVQPALFISSNTGKTVLEDTVIEANIPKQFPDQT